MLKFVLRLLLIGLALFILYVFGRSTTKTLWYRMAGTVVEGRVSGFLAGKYGASVQQEATAIRNGRRKARRPVYQYPVSENGLDSLTGKSEVATLLSFSQFELNEQVTVVFDPENPQDSYIFSGQLLLTGLLLILFGCYVLYMGVTGKGG